MFTHAAEGAADGRTGSLQRAQIVGDPGPIRARSSGRHTGTTGDLIAAASGWDEIYASHMDRDQIVGTVDLSTGVCVAFTEQGDRSGPAVLLLHPWVESLNCFDRVTPLLPGWVHVLAMDQRGHGNADAPDDGYDLDTLAGDVRAFLDAVGLQSAVLVGSSSGGYVAQQVAVRSPERVAGLVLIGSPLSLRGRAPFADDVEQLTDPVDPAWVREFLKVFPLGHAVPDWYVEARVLDGARICARVWRQSLAGLTTSPAPTEIGSIMAPTLILYGDRDELLVREDHMTLAARIPDSRIVGYEGVGHLVLWEIPEEVADQTIRFVERLSAGP